ncbi:MAG TPA: hypothetical protein VK923_11135 [Euzebyales bacterium]|nr:hypothetical protein [Euzebyales bacterium]
MATVGAADGLAVLDFSGTLSLGAARFAAQARLSDELRRSGLANLGIASPEVFWDALVVPTWSRGSTTTEGYVTVLSAAAVTHLREGDTAVDDATVRNAVQRFADRYFAASTIDDAWRPCLHRLVDLPRTAVVVATDHYAEATAHIVGQLAHLDVDAVAVRPDTPGSHADPPARPSDAPSQERAVLVANSADVGCHKRSSAFWSPVVDIVGTRDRVAVIDDFGANEAEADAYAHDARVQRRRQATTSLLADVFDAEVTTCPFVIAGEDDAGAVVRLAADAAVGALSPPDGRARRLP